MHVFFQALVLAAAASGGAAPAGPTAEQYYARALDTMNALPQPSYMTFALQLRAGGGGVWTQCNPKKRAEIGIFIGKGERHTAEVGGEYALAGNAAALKETAAYCATDLAFLKPAWPAVHDWMRYGLNEPPPAQQRNPRAAAAAPGLHTIATVTAVAPAAYRIYERGPQTCPDGGGGYGLHLVARSDPDAHPLTDVIVDTRTMRFCMMRFALVNATAAGTGVKGDMTISFGANSGYWTVTAGHAVLSLRLFGAQFKHFTLDLDYSDMQYPAALPQAIPVIAGQGQH